MNSEEFVDITITSLKVISMVQKNGRLCIRKGQLSIEPDDRWQGLRRWLLKDSRDQILMHMRNSINNAIKLSKQLISNQIEVDLKHWTIQRLIGEMTNSRGGLVNLKTTYSEDPTMMAAIDVLIERLEAHCGELQTFSDTKPPPSQTTNHRSTSKN